MNTIQNNVAGTVLNKLSHDPTHASLAKKPLISSAISFDISLT